MSTTKTITLGALLIEAVSRGYLVPVNSYELEDVKAVDNTVSLTLTDGEPDHTLDNIIHDHQHEAPASPGTDRSTEGGGHEEGR